MGAKLPYMPLWVSDFLGSSRVQEMPGEARGLYLLALAVAWNSGTESLPGDDDALSRLLGLSAESWERYRADVLQFFERGKDGRLRNEKLSKVARWAETVSETRRKAARVRWDNANASANASAPAMQVDMQNGCKIDANADASQAQAQAQAQDSSSQASRARGIEPELPEVDRSWPADASAVHHRLSSHPWNFGHANVSAILDRGVTGADVEAWEAWAEVHGWPAASKGIRQFRHPREVPDREANAKAAKRARMVEAINRMQSENGSKSQRDRSL